MIGFLQRRIDRRLAGILPDVDSRARCSRGSSDACARIELAKAITIAILAMGGEGGGVLADWIVDLAEHSGYHAQTTSVPGVAQRTGVNDLLPRDFSGGGGKGGRQRPVLALMPVPGEVDIVIASELMEAGRAVQRGLVTPDRTTLIASTHRVYSMTEKTAMARRPRRFSESDRSRCAACEDDSSTRDFARIAEDTRSVISAPLFGALAATGALPFTREQFEEAIRAAASAWNRSLAAFRGGISRQRREPPQRRLEHGTCEAVRSGRVCSRSPAKIENEFPAASHEILFAGRRAARRLSGRCIRHPTISTGSRRFATWTRNTVAEILRCCSETARYLALWMSYEDAIRGRGSEDSAHALRARPPGGARRAGSRLLQINEFLHPGVAGNCGHSSGGAGSLAASLEFDRGG